MAQGDIDAVAGIADVISSRVGTVTTRPLIPVSWQQGPSTLGLGTVAPPVRQGGLNGDAGGGNKGDPDTYLGSFTLQTGPSTLAVGTVAQPVHQGDVGDIIGTPDISVLPSQKVAGFASWISGVSSLAPGAVVTPKTQGDVGSVGMSPTPKNEWNDSAQGAGTLIAWNSGASSLVPGSIPQVRNQGDIDAIYSTNEQWKGVNSTWNTGAPTIVTGVVASATHGNGDVTNDGELAGITGTNSTSSWILGLIQPVLSAVINGLTSSIALTWTSIGTQSVYNVYRSVNGGAFSLYQANLTGLAYTDTSVLATNTYSYYVASVLPYLQSNIVNPYATIVAPILSDVTSGGAIQLNWTTIGITTTYSVFRSVNSGAFSLLANGVVGLTYTDSALVRGNTYAYYVVSLFPQLQSNTIGPIVGTFTDIYSTVGPFTWTKRAGAFKFDLLAAAAGGGGGAGSLLFSGTPGGGAGGGGGEFATGINLDASILPATVNGTIGAGGVGAPSTATSQGTNGGATTFGALLTLNGGLGGPSNPQAFGSGGRGGTGGSTTIAGLTLVDGGQGGDGTNTQNAVAAAPNTTQAPAGGGGSNGQPSLGIMPGTGGSVGAIAIGGAGGAAAFDNPGGTRPVTAGDGANGGVPSSGIAGAGGGGGGSAGMGSPNNNGFLVHAGNGGNGSSYGGGGGGGGSGVGSNNMNGAAGGTGALGYLKLVTYLW